MLSYRHAFHAGNYADVLKHSVLIQILNYLVQKDKPILYVDTHAGAGEYDLRSDEAVKTQEFQAGIGALWKQSNLPTALASYLSCVKAFNSGNLVGYPGSPWIAEYILRAQDRLVFCELHTADTRKLHHNFANKKNIFCFDEDGYKKAIALMPPPERRGLVLIDPSYEVKEEYFWVVENVQQMVRRFATGVYAIWYPVAHEKLTRRMIHSIKTSFRCPAQQFELGITQDHEQPGMTGSGMIVLNPPWQLKQIMTEVLPVIANTLGDEAYWKIEDLITE